MDAPKGRYRVEEKDGRLVVIDTATGAPGSSATPPPRPGAAPPHGRRTDSSPLGLFDRYARLLLRLVVARWDEEGRAVLAWEWEQNGRKQRWDSVLGAADQKRLGRALAAISAFPIAILLSIFAGSGLWLLLPFAFGAAFWGVWAINRMQGDGGEGAAGS